MTSLVFVATLAIALGNGCSSSLGSNDGGGTGGAAGTGGSGGAQAAAAAVI